MVLKRALASDPKDAIAHNYLGISASMKGDQVTAVDELKSAINLDPVYGDAYFNISIVFAKQAAPDFESARGYYERALKLGSEPDASLEQIIGLVDVNGVRTVGAPAAGEERRRLIAAIAWLP